MNRIAFHAVLSLLVLGTSAAHAQNLVRDGDFEMAMPDASGDVFFGATGAPGSFDAFWTIPQGTVGLDIGSRYVYGGNQSLWLNADSPLESPTNTITQTLTTIPGQSYLLTFFANNGGPEPLTVTFGGAVVGGGPILIPANSFPNQGGAGVNAAAFTRFSFVVTAASNLTDLAFSATGGIGSGPAVTLELDDISVIANDSAVVPEPGALALLAPGLLPLVGVVRRRHGA